MKKITVFFLCLCILFSLCACANKENESAVEKSGSLTSSENSSSLVKISGVNSIVAPSKMNEEKFSCNVASPEGLILRLGPSTEYDAIGVIEDGTALTELANQNGWVYVDVQGQQGWVFGQFVEYK